MQWRFKGRKGDMYTKITSSTVETPIIPNYTDENGNPVRVNVYGLILANTSATVQKVTIKDALGGGVKTVFEILANDTKTFSVDRDNAMEQDSGNNPWTATCGTSLDSMEITVLFTKD